MITQPTIAITRDISPRITKCELTHLQREPIDYERAVRQHDAYRETLESIGLEVVRLPAPEEFADSVFIEDTAVVFPHVAVITRPGAESRRGETAAVADVLRNYRPLSFIEAPGTVDGGDVLVVAGRIFVGISTRTNREGARQLARLTGWPVTEVEVSGCLHLKSAVTAVADDTLLVNPGWIDIKPFDGFRLVRIEEENAANALRIGSTLVYARGYPLTAAALQREGIDVRFVDADEIAKAEGAVTCCSLIL